MAVSDKKHVRLVALDQVEGFGVRRRIGRTRMRLHLKVRLLCAQAHGEVSCHAWSGAKEEQAEMAPRAHRRQPRDEVDACNRLAHGAALPPGRPNYPAAIRQAQVRRFEHASELAVGSRAHHEFRVDCGDEVMAATVHELRDAIKRCIHIEAVDSHTEDAGLVHRVIIIRRLLTKTVAVDLNPATREVVTGTELFAREVGSRLQVAAPELRWRFFASRPRAGLDVDLTVVPFPRLWSQVRLPLALARARADLLFVPSHAVPFAWPGKALTVVHDLAFERHAQAYSPTERAYLQLTTRWAARRCKLLIAVSESTRSDLVALYGIKPERIRVVPLGGGEPVAPAMAPVSRLAELGLDGTFVLQVGRIETRKNQEAALAAVERLEAVTLAVAGPQRDLAMAARLTASSRCRVLGRVDQPTLELLYQHAAAVIVPSLYEGFGLPVLEAMARGKVVVAAATSSLPEVGGDAVLYADRLDDPEALAKVLARALGDKNLRAKLAGAARGRAATFTWDRCAAGVVAVIRELVA
jgi:glycosyltransferase involved in cell wall biosynthesis